MQKENLYIHESSVIDPGARIGQGTKIWHFCHIGAETVIGEGCSLGQNVYVGKAKIGSRVKIQNNVSIYDGIEIQDDVFCGPSVVFTNVTNPRAAISRRHEYKKTLIQAGATLGANATILCGIVLGKYCFIAAGATVTKNVKAFALMQGIPARQTGWMSIYGEKIPLPLSGKGTYECPHTGHRYCLKQTKMSAEKIK